MAKFLPGHKKVGGRKKGTPNGAALFKDWCEQRGAKFLVGIADGTEPDFKGRPKIRAEVAIYIFDRVYGKPKQAHDLTSGGEAFTLADLLKPGGGA